MRSDWIPPKVCEKPDIGRDEHSIWEDGHWTCELLLWQHQLYVLFPTQRREVERLTPKQCAETMRMYEEEYITWCAVERMTNQTWVQPVPNNDKE